MQKAPLKIYIDRLKDDDTEQILETVSPDFIDLDESELIFNEKVLISGQAYLAKSHLILDLKIKTKAIMPCSICNEKVEIPIEIDDFTHTIETVEVKSAIYDYAEEVRSALLLKIPQFLECHDGHCPHRKDVKKYLRDEDKGEVYNPFSKLTL